MAGSAAWSTQQLAEFLATVSSLESEASAALGAVERAAEALDAEVAAIVTRNEVVASVGYPVGSAPIGEFQAVARGDSRHLVIPGAGACPAIAVPLDHPPDATLILARSGSEGLSREEISLVHGMARVTSMTLRMLGLLDEERSLRDEQAALRRVATLVAGGVAHEQVFGAVAEEVSRLAAADIVQVFRYEPDGAAVRVAAWGRRAEELEIGVRFPTGGNNLLTMVLRSGRPGRIDDAGAITGSSAPIARHLGVRSAVGSPIVVDGHLWGMVMAATTRPEPMAAETEQRFAGFTELVATAISNAQARAELAASRMRVVAAADEMRRRIERNLHDGTQQRLITLSLKLRGLHDNIPDEQTALRSQMSHLEEGLASLLDELREISRGLHPPMLSAAGLGPALRSLVRRAALPVDLDVRLAERLPEPLEVAAYYVVSEALANAAKHAGASGAEVQLHLAGGVLRVEIRDDGAGGADPARGSGIVGLRDRVEALGGTMRLTSPPGEGTSMLVELPMRQAWEPASVDPL